MTRTDGHYIDTIKIINNGPEDRLLNLAILSEGYRENELQNFHAYADNFVNILSRTAPFNIAWRGINVYRVDVASTDSGADDPVSTDPQFCQGATGATARTYFDATFCGDGINRRHLVVDSETALDIANTDVSVVHAILVNVNSPINGGTAKTIGEIGIGVFSLAPGSEEIGLHELGHLFGLADEYEYFRGCGLDGPDQNHYTGGEPVQPNVTIELSRITNKWRSLILDTTRMPTTHNDDCSRCDPQPNPVGGFTVGTFEGAYYHHCEIYRPQFNCRMRELGNPFCFVCQDRILQMLSPRFISWVHLGQASLPNHPMEADFDCSALPYPAKFAVTGDFDGDGQDEIAVAPEAGRSAGNDFWVMRCNY